MTALDRFVQLRDWRKSLYRGVEQSVESFLKAVDATLAPGWVRDNAYENTRMQPDRVRCYMFDPGQDAAVRAWLQLVTATRVRGGPIQVIHSPPSGDASRIGQIVEEFVKQSVLPAATKAGVLCTRPVFGPRSAITSAIEMLFTRFADTVEGEWPFNNRAQELWDELVTCCLVEQSAVDRDELSRWFGESGWDPPVAIALTDRFFADSNVLAKRLAAMSE